MQQPWFTDVCEYYKVDPITAERLGTRSPGRRPDLPGSATCEPVSGMTFEELWDSKPRETIQQKMDFYKDIGAWQVFRQSVYRKMFDITPLIQFIDFSKETVNICEYGCGIAQFTNNIIEKVNGNVPKNVNFTIVDVEGEHLHFAKWRLEKKAPEHEFEVHTISEEYMVPKFERKLDFVLMTDVLEHAPNPLELVKNVCENSNDGAILIESWVKVDDPGYADLKESADQREETEKYFSENYEIVAVYGDIRIHRKK